LDRKLDGPQSQFGRGGEESTVDEISLNKLKSIYGFYLIMQTKKAI
jgi:hypothetical protein